MNYLEAIQAGTIWLSLFCGLLSVGTLCGQDMLNQKNYLNKVWTWIILTLVFSTLSISLFNL